MTQRTFGRAARIRRSRIRIAIVTTIGFVATALFSWLAIAMRFSRRVVEPPGPKLYDVRLIEHHVADRLVTLERNADTVLRGEYLLVTQNSSSWLACGEIVREDRHSVTRRVLDVGGHFPSGSMVRFTGWRWMTPNAAGLNARAVSIPTEFGSAPAWLVSRESRTSKRTGRTKQSRDRRIQDADAGIWAIHIHGRASRRQEVIRSALVCHELVSHQLMVSYRDDGDASASSIGRYALGSTEWADIESALEYASLQGATGFILYGWSMGGTIALQCAARSRFRDAIRGLILDSPALDWVNILNHHARLSRVPTSIASSGMWMLERGIVRTGNPNHVSFNKLAALSVMEQIGANILILHSDDDGYVPIEPSQLLSERFAEQVTLDVWQTARHCKLWNFDPQRYGSTVQIWLKRELAEIKN